MVLVEDISEDSPPRSGNPNQGQEPPRQQISIMVIKTDALHYLNQFIN